MQREHPSRHFFTIGIAALFLAGFFLLVVFGAGSYRDTVSGQRDNMGSRALLSYLSTTLHGGDAKDMVRVEQGEPGQVLVIRDAHSEYALRLYLSEGNLVEDYAPDGAPLAPKEAQIIGATDTFSVRSGADGLLTVVTDAGRVQVYLRSEGGVQ